MKTQPFEEEHAERINKWFSPTGLELQRCLVLQGYEPKMFHEYLLMFGSYFTAHELIRNIKEENK